MLLRNFYARVSEENGDIGDRHGKQQLDGERVTEAMRVFVLNLAAVNRSRRWPCQSFTAVSS
jgi:hypothetical protein